MRLVARLSSLFHPPCPVPSPSAPQSPPPDDDGAARAATPQLLGLRTAAAECGLPTLVALRRRLLGELDDGDGRGLGARQPPPPAAVDDAELARICEARGAHECAGDFIQKTP